MDGLLEVDVSNAVGADVVVADDAELGIGDDALDELGGGLEVGGALEDEELGVGARLLGVVVLGGLGDAVVVQVDGPLADTGPGGTRRRVSGGGQGGPEKAEQHDRLHGESSDKQADLGLAGNGNVTVLGIFSFSLQPWGSASRSYIDVSSPPSRARYRNAPIIRRQPRTASFLFGEVRSTLSKVSLIWRAPRCGRVPIWPVSWQKQASGQCYGDGASSLGRLWSTRGRGRNVRGKRGRKDTNGMSWQTRRVIKVGRQSPTPRSYLLYCPARTGAGTGFEKGK
ncbi:hypothetical protein F5Y17DRAFT_387216 [Xylariaceae sp. FL0594]|nr:hypothetical protein F5Y17DRAFT_387216 [Xylariaceae sp. FL0594]